MTDRMLLEGLVYKYGAKKHTNEISKMNEGIIYKDVPFTEDEIDILYNHLNDYYFLIRYGNTIIDKYEWHSDMVLEFKNDLADTIGERYDFFNIQKRSKGFRCYASNPYPQNSLSTTYMRFGTQSIWFDTLDDMLNAMHNYMLKRYKIDIFN